ncbi:MAG TPA: lipid II flippase MurJ, partial [Rectinemataceae bacterium]|nr:lipid II flippase MurJ [Rectinemataceae bacterium]
IFGAGSFGVVQAGLANLINFSYYSKVDTKTPVAVSIVAGTAGAILLQFAVVRLFGAVGLSAATAIAGMATLLLGAVFLSKRHGLDILGAQDIFLAFAILALGVASGFVSWTPWEMGLPVVYYYFITLKKYGLSPRKLADMARRAFGRSGRGEKGRAR